MTSFTRIAEPAFVLLDDRSHSLDKRWLPFRSGGKIHEDYSVFDLAGDITLEKYRGRARQLDQMDEQTLAKIMDTVPAHYGQDPRVWLRYYSLKHPGVPAKRSTVQETYSGQWANELPELDNKLQRAVLAHTLAREEEARAQPARKISKKEKLINLGKRLLGRRVRTPGATHS